MNDLDQQQLANRLAQALVDRIGASLDRSDLAAARRDLEHVFRLEGRAEALRIAQLFRVVQQRWPAGAPGGEEIALRLAEAERRIARQAAEQQVLEALNSTTVRPLRTAPALPEGVLERAAAGAGDPWTMPPLFVGTWTEADAGQVADDIALIHRALFDDAFFRYVLGIGIVGSRRCALSCYDAALVEFRLAPDEADGPLSAVFLVGAFGALPIDGTSPRMHALNAQGHLDISTEEKAGEYIRLFCAVVHGEAGPFTIVSGHDDVRPFALLAEAAPLPPAIDALQPAVVSRPDEPDSRHAWLVDAGVLYADTVFRARFGLAEGGMVEMLFDEPIAAGLPIRQPRFVHGIRQFLAAEEG